MRATLAALTILALAGPLHVSPSPAARASGRLAFVETPAQVARTQPAPQTGRAESPALRVGVLAGGRYTVAAIPLETYVARVLAGEAARESRPAALEALAIAVRTFALANLSRHRADGFDLCDQTHCQVLRTATPATTQAAEATAGRLLLRGGAPASIFYTASCGGRTERPSAVWPGAEDPPFLPSQSDDACDGAPAWTAAIAAADLRRALDAAGFRGDRLDDMRVAARSGSGRVARLELRGLTPPAISGQDLRVAVGRTLGWQHIKSTAFELRRQGTVYRFTGHGSGHGVGLCVIGSARLAERGESAARILARYYPGLAISTLAPIVTTTASTATKPPVEGASARGTVPPDARRERDAPIAAAPRPAARAEDPPTPSSPASASSPASRANASRAVPSSVTGIDIALPDEDAGSVAVVEAQALRARDELARTLGVVPPRVTLRFHPTVPDYERATGMPWFTSATVVGETIHLSPLAALRDRGILEATIRRGLVHRMIDAALENRPAWVRDGMALYYADPDAGAAAGRIKCPSENELRQPVSAGALANAYARAKACVAKQIAAGKSWREVR